MGTKDTLVSDLLKKEPSTYRNSIINKAKQGYYHDFESKIFTPKAQLLSDLTHAGFEDLANKVKCGDYDE